MTRDDTARYELILDPCDNWTVWDLSTDEPAEFAGVVLFGLSEEQAIDSMRVLNELHVSRENENSSGPVRLPRTA